MDAKNPSAKAASAGGTESMRRGMPRLEGLEKEAVEARRGLWAERSQYRRGSGGREDSVTRVWSTFLLARDPSAPQEQLRNRESLKCH